MALSLSVDHPYPALTKTNGKAFSITLSGAKGPIEVTPDDSLALGFTIGSMNPDGPFTLQLQVHADVSEPKVHTYNIRDSNKSQLSAHVLVMPEPSSNHVLVFFFGADGNMYLLSHKRGAKPVVTRLPDYPANATPISKHKQDADKHPPFLIPPLSGTEAAYVTCYLLDLQTLPPDGK
ncbi:hypothetical protein [Corallococcus llansteffanensis]|uniref:Uncharacterized protein n=1 Tax=Corallococcus llansteffanensis TaxID=2316731 RepID=A0A3A8PWV1_9BACT|nr:hypothetical protein [Corallococcus llansteffanensis]RKH60853.1 hypothetical protein D7V93_12710 [Corallococcus llansteffanensis]